MSLRKFLLFGDSITQYSHSQAGFAMAPAIQDLYQRKLDVLTRGFSGYNTRWASVVLREVLEAESNIALMYIFLGTNDAATTFQAVPLDEYRDNLRSMVELAMSHDIKIAIVGPALHDQNRNRVSMPDLPEPFSSSAATRKYADVAKSVAEEFKLPFVDLWTAFQKSGGWSEADLLENKVDLGHLLPDGVHYSPEAYKIFYDELMKSVLNAYPEFDPENLKTLFPYYRDIDLNDYEQSLLDSLKDSP